MPGPVRAGAGEGWCEDLAGIEPARRRMGAASARAAGRERRRSLRPERDDGSRSRSARRGSASPQRRARKCPTSPPSAAASPTNPRSPRQATRSTWTLAANTPGAGHAVGRGLIREIALMPHGGEERQETLVESGSTAAPRRRARGPEQRAQPRPALRQIAATASARARRRKFAFLAAARHGRAWRQPCCRTRRRRPARAGRAAAQAPARRAAGITASATGTSPAMANSPSRRREGAAASSSRHHSVAILPSLPTGPIRAPDRTIAPTRPEG